MSLSEKYREYRDLFAEEETHVTIAGMELKRGDILEISYSRRILTVEFLGYNRFVHLFHFRDVVDFREMLVPYRSVKSIKKISGTPETQDSSPQQ